MLYSSVYESVGMATPIFMTWDERPFGGIWAGGRSCKEKGVETEWGNASYSQHQQDRCIWRFSCRIKFLRPSAGRRGSDRSAGRASGNATVSRVADGGSCLCAAFCRCSCSKSGTVESDGFWRALRRQWMGVSSGGGSHHGEPSEGASGGAIRRGPYTIPGGGRYCKAMTNWSTA